MTGPEGDTGKKGDKGMNIKDCSIFALDLLQRFSPVGQFYSLIQ